jgi:acyl carrier protein
MMAPSIEESVFVRIFRSLQASGEISPQIIVDNSFLFKTLDQVALDSVGLITLLSEIEEQTGAVIDANQITAETTGHDIELLISGPIRR